MHVLLFDDPAIRPHLLPFTFTRPVAALRCGILTIAEKWQRRLASPTVGYLTQPYLQAKFPAGEVAGPAAGRSGSRPGRSGTASSGSRTRSGGSGTRSGGSGSRSGGSGSRGRGPRRPPTAPPLPADADDRTERPEAAS